MYASHSRGRHNKFVSHLRTTGPSSHLFSGSLIVALQALGTLASGNWVDKPPQFHGSVGFVVCGGAVSTRQLSRMSMGRLAAEDIQLSNDARSAVTGTLFQSLHRLPFRIDRLFTSIPGKVGRAFRKTLPILICTCPSKIKQYISLQIPAQCHSKPGSVSMLSNFLSFLSFLLGF